ncbi:hypothetical protein EJ07DRAFT_156966 [Lizonia empirigonia]|nr:hypothetical protein EJ07DRAFT_156966 [Lizonia empirigonia]
MAVADCLERALEGATKQDHRCVDSRERQRSDNADASWQRATTDVGKQDSDQSRGWGTICVWAAAHGGSSFPLGLHAKHSPGSNTRDRSLFPSLSSQLAAHSLCLPGFVRAVLSRLAGTQRRCCPAVLPPPCACCSKGSLAKFTLQRRRCFVPARSICAAVWAPAPIAVDLLL